MRLQGVVYRGHNPRWSFLPLSGEGAARYGGRFNSVGMPALYTSWRMETAWREAQQGFAFKAQPLTICAYDTDCENVADLTDPVVAASLAVAPAALGCPWEDLAARGITPPSWILAETLKRSGIAAIVVPSFAPGATTDDRNVVFWHWSAALPHRLTVIDDQARLPRDDASWR